MMFLVCNVGVTQYLFVVSWLYWWLNLLVIRDKHSLLLQKARDVFFDSLKDRLPVMQLINMDESFIAGGKTTSSNKSRILKMPSFGHRFLIFFLMRFQN